MVDIDIDIDIDIHNRTDRYVAVWNDPDAERRRAAMCELWSADAVHVWQPPREILQVAEGLGFDRLVLEARGHHALKFRVTRAHKEFVAPGTCVFRSRGDTDRLHGVVKFNWSMAPQDGGEVACVGLEIFLLGPDCRLVSTTSSSKDDRNDGNAPIDGAQLPRQHRRRYRWPVAAHA
ncbi:hypothetical protein [Streptomyces sp. NPDC040750]|uniref:hypothetical protein n=1 Tax=Streptomyces sp. NPDC040750 TaxID=3154491 RepID=UPI0033CC1241